MTTSEAKAGKRGKYDDAFKAAAIKRVIEGGEAANAVEKSLKLGHSVISRWLKQSEPKRAYKKRVNGNGHDTAPPANNVRDAILFLKHAKQEMYAQLARGEIKSFSKVHLWTLEAHAALTGES